MNEPARSNLAVEVHVWWNLSYADLIPLLETLHDYFPDVRTRRETEGPVQAGGLDAGLALTILAGWLGAEVLKTFFSELTKDAYRGLRAQLLRLFPKAAVSTPDLQLAPMSIVVGQVRFYFEKDLTEEEFLERLRKANDYIQDLPDQVLLDPMPSPPDATMIWDAKSQAWRSSLDLDG